MRAVVTGATGFVGRQVVVGLQQRGFDVVALSSRRLASEQVPSGVTAIVCDLTDPAAVRSALKQAEASHLVHCAWASVVSGLWSSPENLKWVKFSLGLAEAFIDTGGRRIIAAGSCGEYDWTGGLCREDLTPLTPSTSYGDCKVALYHGMKALCEGRGIPFAWGRLFFLYGPGEHPSRLGASVVLSSLKREAVPCSHGMQLRDYLHVADAGTALAALTGSTLTGAYNLATGEAVRVKDVILELAEQAGHSDGVALGARPAAVHEPPLIVADMTKTRAALNWSPRFTLESGAKDTVQWFRNNKEHALIKRS